MKKIFTYLFMGSFLYSFAQLPVSQTAEKKRVVLEEFTGKTCTWCPAGHKIGAEMKAADPNHVFLINIHEGSFAGGTPNYRTNFGSAIASQAGSASVGWPSGSINRQVFSGTSSATSRSAWVANAATVRTQDAYVNVAVEASVDVVTNELTVNVEAYYTANAPTTSNFLNVAITQDDIWGPQTGASANYPENYDAATGQYKHGHMLRHMLTGQWGEEITTTTMGTLITKTYTYDLPASIGDVDMDVTKLNIVAFMTETQQEIINAGGAKPVLANLTNQLEAEALSLTVPAKSCSGVITPEIKVRNFGQATITTMDIVYSANGGTEYTYAWTGNILPGYNEEIVMPDFGFAVELSNDIDVRIDKVNGATDDIPANNAFTTAVVASVDEFQTNTMTLTFESDQYSGTDSQGDAYNESSWALFNSAGLVIQEAERGDVTSSTPYAITLNLPDYDCYVFEFYDSFGDGLTGSGPGTVSVDFNGTNVLSGSGSFSKLTANFATVDAAGEGNGNGDGSSVNPNSIKSTNPDITFAVYPNPATEVLMISFEGTIESVEIINVLGATVLNTNESIVNVSNLDLGIYFVKLTDKSGNTVSQSFVKK